MQSTIRPNPEDCCGLRNYTLVDEELTKTFLKLETFDYGKQKLILLPTRKKLIGTYEIKIKVQMVKYVTQAVYLKFKVKILGCKPAALEPFYKMLTNINYDIQLPKPGELATLDTQNL